MRYGEYGTQVHETESFALSSGPFFETHASGTSSSLDCFEDEYHFLLALGFSKPILTTMKNRAIKNGSTMEDELLASTFVTPGHYYEAIARYLKVPFMATVPTGLVFDQDGIDSQLALPRMVRIHQNGAPPALLIVPKAKLLKSLSNLLLKDPSKRNALLVTTPDALRTAVWETGRKRRIKDAVQNLADSHPVLSAREVMWGQQGFFIGLIVSALISIYVAESALGQLLLHLILSFVYLFSLIIRLLALSFQRRKMPMPKLPAGPPPIYSILVPLYHEAAVVEQLVSALNSIHWPKSRLDIKLICESDDPDTLRAVRNMNLEPHFEIVEVPVLSPRTKPKALSYTMAGIRGEYVVIYDAEDIPHPDQLKEAYAGFSRQPQEVACLQSPLKIMDPEKRWLTSLFALEYTGLFQVILPVLARFHFPLPLGGTSNHFKVEALKVCGGWDPFNVTEDADLGIRLHRMGFRSGVLSLPTLETAPENCRIWLGQRKRWFKGWMQTFLVHSRQPVMFCRQAGLFSTAAFLFIIGGGLLSALAHPFILFMVTNVFFAIRNGDQVDSFDKFIFWVDVANLIMSYAVFFTLGRSCISDTRTKLRLAFTIPVYWIMMAIAAWWGMFELLRKPHHWQKTPHFPVGTSPVPK